MCVYSSAIVCLKHTDKEIKMEKININECLQITIWNATGWCQPLQADKHIEETQ